MLSSIRPGPPSVLTDNTQARERPPPAGPEAIHGGSGGCAPRKAGSVASCVGGPPSLLLTGPRGALSIQGARQLVFPSPLRSLAGGPGALTIGIGVCSLLVGHDSGCGVIDLSGEKEGTGWVRLRWLPRGRRPPWPCSVFLLQGSPRRELEAGRGALGHRGGRTGHLCCQPGPALPPCCPASRESWPPLLPALASAQPGPGPGPSAQAPCPAPLAPDPSTAAPTNQAPASVGQPKVTGEAGWGLPTKRSRGS